jgi:hypothetical protein
LAENIPQGLKPIVFSATYGTTKVVPFQNIEFFRSLFSHGGMFFVNLPEIPPYF